MSPTDPSYDTPLMQLGALSLESNLFLSPLAGYTNLPFRLTVRELGGLDLATTDFGQRPFTAGKQSQGSQTCRNLPEGPSAFSAAFWCGGRGDA